MKYKSIESTRQDWCWVNFTVLEMALYLNSVYQQAEENAEQESDDEDVDFEELV